ncbi:MAG: bestrophin [Myxococcales bacterium]|nr:bestrophin [Myxococcales bacterium]
MIIFDRSERISWIRIFLMRRGGVLSRIWLRVLMATLFACLVTAIFHYHLFDEIEELQQWLNQDLKLTLTPLPFQLIGLALSIFLGFRNNSSYDRFWEGRKLWGRMINITRTLTRQIFSLIDPAQAIDDPDEALETKARIRRELVYHLVAYVHAFRHHLRDEKDFPDSAPFLPEATHAQLRDEPNGPIWLLHAMGERLHDAWLDGWVNVYHLSMLEQSLTTITDIQGGCERIKKTPIPFAYTILMHRIVGIYCFALPLGIYDTVGLLTPIVVLFISYSFFALDAIGDEIEEPFGYDDNDLSLGAFTTMLEIECRTRLGDDDLPEPAQPVNHVLS